MSTVNKAILIGNLGRDPELKRTNSGKAVCEFSVATSGRDSQKTDWHRVIVWDQQAELCAKFLSKGRQVYIEGRIQYREFEDKEGNKRTSTEIVAHTVQFLGGGGGGEKKTDEAFPF